MARRKFIYHYLVDNKEVSKEKFLNELSGHFFVCEDDHENPLLNISTLDVDARDRKFNYLKRNPNCGQIYINDLTNKSHSFRITREEIKPNGNTTI